MDLERRVRSSRQAALGHLGTHLRQQGALSALQHILRYVEAVLETLDVSELSLC